MMKRKTKEAIAGWIYVLPSFLTLLIFIAIPIVQSFYFSLTDYSVLSSPVFCGLKNYITAFSDEFIQASMRNTVCYVLITVPLQTFFSILFAAILASKFQNRYGRFVKGCMFVPVISSSILVGTLFTMLFATDDGIINEILGLVGIPHINWLGQTSTALLTVCMASIWKNVGYFLVIVYAGIMDIPASYYEAAEVDGATKMQQFLEDHHALPQTDHLSGGDAGRHLVVPGIRYGVRHDQGRPGQIDLYPGLHHLQRGVP